MSQNLQKLLEFRKELEQLINKYSLENLSDTPDFILAEYLVYCFESANWIINRRKQWYGDKTK